MTFSSLCYELFYLLGVLDDQLLVKVVKNKLMSNPCRNQGFVLDGFPKTWEQAEELFSGEMLHQTLSCCTHIHLCVYDCFSVFS